MFNKDNYSIFLAIDNYNYPQMETANSSEVQDVLRRHLFQPLNAITPRYVMKGVVFGSSDCADPAVEDIWRTARLIDSGRANYPGFATSCGFTLSEIEAMCTILGVDPIGLVDEVFDDLRDYRGGSRVEPVWSCEDIFRLFTDRLGESCRISTDVPIYS